MNQLREARSFCDYRNHFGKELNWNFFINLKFLYAKNQVALNLGLKYSLSVFNSRVNFARVLSIKSSLANKKPGKSTKKHKKTKNNHEKPWKSMKNYEKSMKINENLWKTVKNAWKSMKNHEKSMKNQFRNFPFAIAKFLL